MGSFSLLTPRTNNKIEVVPCSPQGRELTWLWHHNSREGGGGEGEAAVTFFSPRVTWNHQSIVFKTIFSLPFLIYRYQLYFHRWIMYEIIQLFIFGFNMNFTQINVSYPKINMIKKISFFWNSRCNSSERCPSFQARNFPRISYNPTVSLRLSPALSVTIFLIVIVSLRNKRNNSRMSDTLFLLDMLRWS